MQNKPLIIGLAGPIGCGKTTLAELLRDSESCGYGVVMSFANGVREEVNAVFGIPTHLMATQEGKATPWVLDLTVRDIMQLWGTNVRRSQDPDYWVKRAMQQVDTLTAASPSACPDFVVFDDVRFPSEANAIRDRGGIVVRLDPYPGWTPTEADKHISEHAMDDYAYDLRFAPDYGDLHSVCDSICDFIEADPKYVRPVF